MKLVGFDLETPQDVPEYGLQPWRARTGEATIKTCAFWSEDGVFETTKRMPSKKYFAKALAICAAEGYTIATWNGMFDIAWLQAIGLEEEVKACKWIDGMLLVKRVDGWRDKKYGGIGFGLKETVLHDWPEEEEYALGEKVTKVPQTEEEWQDMLAYNLKDSKYTCLLVRLYLERLSPEERRGALIEAKGLVPIALSSINGVPLNVEAMDALQVEVNKSRDENQEIFGADLKIIASPKKLGELIFTEWGYEPIKHTPSGNPATDKESLLKLAILYPEDPRFGALMALRKCNTRQSKFIDGVRKAMEYNGGPVAYPKPSIAGTYCVPGYVEVLTREGWCRLDDWRGGDIVQVRPDLSMGFLPATRFEGPVVHSWVRVKHNSLECMFTAGHTMPILSQKNEKWNTEKAGEWLDLGGGTRDMPVAGNMALNGVYTEEQMRVFAMVQADGHFCKTRGRLKFTFQKVRKIVRARRVLDDARIEYHEYICEKYPHRTEIVVGSTLLPDWLTPQCKRLGAWLFDTTPEGLSAFVDEVQHWDGTPSDSVAGVKYASMYKENCEWVATAAHLVGRKASIGVERDKRGTTLYTATISGKHLRGVRNIKSHHVACVEEHRWSYCAETQTGFWLARSNGSIFITGNTGRMTYSSKQKTSIRKGKQVVEDESDE